MKDRSDLINAIQRKLDTISLDDIIVINGDRSISVNGVLLQQEQVTRLREGAQLLLNNYAWTLVRNQTNYEAIKIGLHTANSTESIQFSKAAIWYGVKMKELLVSLAGLTTTNEIEQELNPN